ncbi:hypothetical protein CAOG_04913 [Capsaspora owczarzaki ATCC 30864]|uniref:Chromosome segregation in meiosis protein 3 domain-containing protein n=1 Tax=Capsaspora owczarzaki (strain ATCC 30864) TaxID=595528 RepID=A0A0D2WR02_CAPO3|nr:hypothetical protein CAOG_04913 [Capsaspora owczarzaki ATCC 30864]KJE94240.1 hypothetical protein CAOG_004913 [Capsaspora owczarzaki ATCC 30864]|eukprot:XP_004347664.2 hypothetical protein CAOG_04913 [Capsaspora owczarzaki ATCC 30864]
MMEEEYDLLPPPLSPTNSEMDPWAAAAASSRRGGGAAASSQRDLFHQDHRHTANMVQVPGITVDADVLRALNPDTSSSSAQPRQQFPQSQPHSRFASSSTLQSHQHHQRSTFLPSATAASASASASAGAPALQRGPSSSSGSSKFVSSTPFFIAPPPRASKSAKAPMRRTIASTTADVDASTNGGKTESASSSDAMLDPTAADAAGAEADAQGDGKTNKDATPALLQSQRNKRPKMDAERLIEHGNGLAKLLEDSPRLPFRRVKGSEASDLKILIAYYQQWTHNLYNSMSFGDMLERLESLGKKGAVRNYVDTLRNFSYSGLRKFGNAAASRAAAEEVDENAPMGSRETDSITARRKFIARRVLDEDSDDGGGEELWSLNKPAANGPDDEVALRTLDEMEEQIERERQRARKAARRSTRRRRHEDGSDSDNDNNGGGGGGGSGSDNNDNSNSSDNDAAMHDLSHYDSMLAQAEQRLRKQQAESRRRPKRGGTPTKSSAPTDATVDGEAVTASADVAAPVEQVEQTAAESVSETPAGEATSSTAAAEEHDASTAPTPARYTRAPRAASTFNLNLQEEVRDMEQAEQAEQDRRLEEGENLVDVGLLLHGEAEIASSSTATAMES